MMSKDGRTAMRNRIPVLICAAASLMIGLPARAAVNASDNAADPAYSSGWTTGTNGGNGFGAWKVALDSGTGATIASSSINGASPPSGNIDVGGVSWGLYSMSGNFVTATRPLTGDLSVGQQIECDFDNGAIAVNGLVELLLLNGNGQDARFQWIADPVEGTDYIIEEKHSNASVGVDSEIASTNNGLHLVFTLTGADTFSLAVTPSGGTTKDFSGTLTGTTGTGINEIQFLVDDAGSPPNGEAFINNLTVVPEPASLGIAVSAVVVLITWAIWSYGYKFPCDKPALRE
jgi:hypothetical protein